MLFDVNLKDGKKMQAGSLRSRFEGWRNCRLGNLQAGSLRSWFAGWKPAFPACRLEACAPELKPYMVP